VARVARRERENLDAVLALPGDLERAAQHEVAPALRHADRDLEPTRGERAELPPVGRRDVGVGDDEDAVHENQLRIADWGLRSRRGEHESATLADPIRIPKSAIRIILDRKSTRLNSSHVSI